jgi:ATP-binding cassette subfamily B protein
MSPLLRQRIALLARALRLFVRPNARRVAFTLALAIAVTIAAACEPLLLKLVVDRLASVASSAAHPGRQGLTIGVALFAIVLTCRILGGAWLMASTWAVRLNLEYQLRSQVAAKLSVLSSRVQTDLGTGAIRFAIDESSPHTARAFTDVAFKLVPTTIYIGVAAWAMARLDASIALMVLCLVPLPAIVGLLAERYQTKRDQIQHAFWMRLWSGYTEVLHGMSTVRAFAKERFEEHRLLRRIRWAFASIQRGVHVDARVAVAAGISELLARVIVLTLGGLLVVRRELTVGSLLAFLGYVGGVFAPVQQIIELYPTLRRAAVALQSVFRVLDAEEEAPDVANATTCPRIRGHVRFESVTFGYRDGQRALDHFDIDVPAGETVALVGASGAGKSTVMRLLQRVHNPTHGRVTIDGHDLRTLRIASVRQQFGVVPQDIVLFNDSVAANISYGRRTATRAEVIAAAHAANAHDFIMQLPHGYDTRLGEGGGTLSGGQRQRIAIARALLVDPAVLLFDEATAALDAESETAVQEALRRFRDGRTTFIIAHRLSTVRDADRIIVMENGSVVGDGTHDILLATCPTYEALVRHQLGAETSPDAEAERTSENREEIAA